MLNKYNQVSELDITVEKNILKDCYFSSPFKIIEPFKIDNFISIMIMSSSSGLMAGDNQSIKLRIEKNSCVEITSQSYEKIHKMKDRTFASRSTQIYVGDNSTLIYNPLPTIPFKDSRFINNTEIRLQDDSSKLIFAEILTAGRIHYGEVFQYSCYQSLAKIYLYDQLIYMDNTKFEPTNMSRFMFFEGYTHLLSIVMVGYCTDLIMEIRKYLTEIEISENIIFGVSQTYCNAIIIKVLGYESESLINIINAIKKLV